MKDRRVRTGPPLTQHLERINDHLKKLSADHATLKSSLRSPTVPVYDPDFPLDAINGQIALQGGQPFYYWSGAWHPIGGGGGCYWASIELEPGLIEGIAVGGSASVPSGGWSGGDMQTSNPSIFTADSTGLTVGVTVPSVFMMEVRINAQAHTNMNLLDPDGIDIFTGPNTDIMRLGGSFVRRFGARGYQFHHNGLGAKSDIDFWTTQTGALDPGNYQPTLIDIFNWGGGDTLDVYRLDLRFVLIPSADGSTSWTSPIP